MPTTTDLALWLAQNVHTIACDESAGQWRSEVDMLVREIQRVVDRPVTIHLLGFCPTDIDGKVCGRPLRARDDQIEIYCPKCRTTRPSDRVRAITMSDARRRLLTWKQLLDANRKQPEGWRVNERTLRDWKSTGALQARGFLWPGNEGDWSKHRHSEDDLPLYAWSEVEELRSGGVPRGNRKRTRAGK